MAFVRFTPESVRSKPINQAEQISTSPTPGQQHTVFARLSLAELSEISLARLGVERSLWGGSPIRRSTYSSVSSHSLILGQALWGKCYWSNTPQPPHHGPAGKVHDSHTSRALEKHGKEGQRVGVAPTLLSDKSQVNLLAHAEKKRDRPTSRHKG